MCIFKELLFGNGLVMFQVLSSASQRSRLGEASIMKLDHLLKSSVPHLADLISIKSSRVLLRQMEEVLASLPVALRALLWMLLYLNYGTFRVRFPLLSHQWDSGSLRTGFCLSKL